MRESKDINVRMSESEDVLIIASDLRQSDKDEVYASHHYKPLEAVQKSYEDSTVCFTVEYRKKPVAMFGVRTFSLLGSRGSIWLLATNDFWKVSRRFAKRSRTYIKGLLERYEYLCNYVDVRNKNSVKWLSHIGATFHEAAPYGAENMKFKFFYFRR